MARNAAPVLTNQPILVECVCGAKYDVAPEHANQKFECEAEGCEAVLIVPPAAWGQKITPLLRKFESMSERDREEACAGLVELGGAAVIPSLMKAVYDPSRSVVNAGLQGLLMLGQPGIDHLIKMMRSGELRMSRVVAMVRETEWWEGASIFCDLIDENRLNEGQVSEAIMLLGEARDRRCISTLTRLRREYPNLSMLVDNALANYRHLDSQVNMIPADARMGAEEGEIDCTEMGALRRSRKARALGCMPVLVFAIAVPAAIVVWQVI